MTPSNVGYFWGDDAFGLDRATLEMAGALRGADGALDVWRTNAEDEDAAAGVDAAPAAGPVSAAGRRRARLLDQIEQRVGTATLFGGGTLVVVRQPGALLREATVRDRLIALVRDVPGGNGLAFTDLIAPGARGPAAAGVLRDAVGEVGGAVREYTTPTRDRMEGWVTRRAAELGIRLAPGAARLLAERIGGFVREGDVDRRRQTELANSELEKLALFRPNGVVERAEIADLVPEAIPGSMWALLDAVGSRRPADASRTAEQVLRGGMPIQVIVSQLHRRVRDLIGVRELLEGGTRPAELVRLLKLQPFRAQRLAEQAGRWTLEDLEDALGALLELDLVTKGIALDGAPISISETRSGLGLQVWIAERVSPGQEPGNRGSERSRAGSGVRRPDAWRAS